MLSTRLQISGLDNATCLSSETYCEKDSQPQEGETQEEKEEEEDLTQTTTSLATSQETTVRPPKEANTFEPRMLIPLGTSSPTGTSGAIPQPPAHFKFVSSSPSCDYHNVASSYLQYFAKFNVAKDGNAKTVCGIECLTNDKCSAFGLEPDYRVCVLFRKVVKVEKGYESPVLAECFLKV